MVFAFASCSSTRNNLVLAHVDAPAIVESDAKAESVTVSKDKPVIYHGPKMAEPAAKIEEVKAVAASRSMIDIAGKIMFPYDSNEITAAEQVNVDKLENLMKEYPNTKINIDGYASLEGTIAYNLALSLRRANAVKDSLVGSGISAERITVSSKGEVDLFGALLPPNRRAVITSAE